MKSIPRLFFMIYSMGFFTPLAAQYISSTASQAGNFIVYPGTSDNLLLRIEIETGTDPVSLENFQFSTNGCTSANPDIVKFRLYYYNDTSAFNIAAASLLGTFTNPWSTNFTFLTPPTGNYSGLSVFNGMGIGKNYFWLTYELSATAKECDTVDAAFINSVVNSVSYVPVQQIPPGHSIIGPCIVGITDTKPSGSIKIYPVPASDQVTLILEHEMVKHVIIDLLEVTGKKSAAIFEGFSHPGTFTIDVPLERVQPGICFIRVSRDGATNYYRFVKL